MERADTVKTLEVLVDKVEGVWVTMPLVMTLTVTSAAFEALDCVVTRVALVVTGVVDVVTGLGVSVVTGVVALVVTGVVDVVTGVVTGVVVVVSPESGQ